jgi:phosphatidylserine/phosphatidylglycerophosphate/cardiolipin synthase-like enzyme
MARERDIKTMLLAAIARARRFIYMEEQYLISIEAARALRAALPNIAHLTILIAGSDVNTDTECIWTYRKEFIDALLRGLPPQEADKVRIFQLVTPPIPAAPPACGVGRRAFTPTFGRHTYVHAKSWVFDDELAVIGSANCNRRGWEFDTEIDAFVFDDRTPMVGTHSFAQRLRMDMWAEHLDLPAARFEDGVASASHWLRAPVTARVLRYCPDDVNDDGITCAGRKDYITDPGAP